MPVGQLIDLNYARQLVKNFKVNKLEKGQIRTDDTQAVWFSKDIILQALGLPAGTGNPDITGIRFYFGAYDKEPGFPANTFDQDKLTLVMVQTKEANITIDRNGTMETAYLDNITEDDPAKPAQPSYPTGAVVGKNPLFNEGQGCPPPFSATGLGLMDW